jgi:hypothetical protein
VSRPSFDRAVRSDGMTLDTGRGPVDLVAVERVESGHHARLNRVEHGYLFGRLTGDYAQAAWVAEALGVEMRSVLRGAFRGRQRAEA